MKIEHRENMSMSMKHSRTAATLLTLVTLISSCANEITSPLPKNFRGDGGLAADGGGTSFDNKPGNAKTTDASVYRDAEPSLDAFFINDPAPPYCAPDGAVSAAPMPSGTPNCPDDKNREACECKHIGETAACWPGKRLNRNHGVCKDGMTTCLDTEFGVVWGPCQRYVLPVEGAIQGADACRCFSSATWSLPNLKPCLYTNGAEAHVYSSHEQAGADPVCSPLPAAAPPEPWTTSTLTVDCAGYFTLCYTIKAGKLNDRKPTDCELHRACVDIDYTSAGQPQTLPAFAGWLASDNSCAQRFITEGGYGEMSVLGKSVECDEVDDGTGGAYVFRRTAYCKPGEDCASGGSGTFGP